MIRRRTVIPFFAWLGKRTTEGSVPDRLVHWRLGRSIHRLSGRQLDLLVAAHRPTHREQP